MKKDKNRPNLAETTDYIPFENSEEAWFWCCLCESLGNERARAQGARVLRPCESADIKISLNRLMRDGRLTEHHVRVLSKYGYKQIPPHENFGQPRRECSLWREALHLLENILMLKGIVTCK